jgi:sugar fermentation stimulation protein A
MTRRTPVKPPDWPTGDSGLYCLLLHLPRRLRLRAGRLEPAVIEPGMLIYVGRARRNLFARLARHMRQRKPRRWHVDYLFPVAEPVGAFVLGGEPVTECDLAQRLSERGGVQRIVRSFGASDCRCSGHLLWAPTVPVGDDGRPDSRFRVAGARYFERVVWTPRGGRQYP